MGRLEIENIAKGTGNKTMLLNDAARSAFPFICLGHDAPLDLGSFKNDSTIL